VKKNVKKKTKHASNSKIKEKSIIVLRTDYPKTNLAKIKYIKM
jgi:hypothetical protein